MPSSVPQSTPAIVIPPAAAAPPVNYSLGHMGAGGTAIAAAASQAIAATQQVSFRVLKNKFNTEQCQNSSMYFIFVVI